MVLKTARRYATAFLQLAIEKDKLNKILEDVTLIHDTIRTSREFELFMKSPIIKSDEKRAVLQTLFAERVDSLTMEFLNFVIRKGRERLFDQIMQGFIERYKEHAGIIDVEVYSAMDLPPKSSEKLNKTLEKITEKHVELTFHERADLLGGLAVRIDDTVIDGTVKHKIDRLKSLFKKEAV